MSEDENTKSSFEPLFKKSLAPVISYKVRPEARKAINTINQLEAHINQAKHLFKNGNLSRTYRQKLVENITTKTAELSLAKARFKHKKEQLVRDGAYYVESL